MRQFVRHPTDIPIDVRPIDVGLAEASCADPVPSLSTVPSLNSMDCSMTSVSQGGLSCEVSAELSVGSLVNIDIPSVSPPYHGTGEIVWCEPCDNHFEVGVRFTNHEEAYKSRMVQQVCQIEHYKNLVFEQEGRILDGNQAAAEWIQKYASDYS